MNKVSDAEIAKALVSLQRIDDDHYQNTYNQTNQLGMLFGGQLLAQGLATAQQTVPPWTIHNCNAYFPSAGSAKQPVDYHVESVRDGKRFANRRVVGRQGDKIILDMLCGFNDTTTGIEHQIDAIPDVLAPESLVKEPDFVKANAHRMPELAVTALSLPFPVEICVIDAEEIFFGERTRPERCYWFRMPSAEHLATDTEHQCILAFLSDYRLGAATLAHHLSPIEVERMMIATLNHSMWFHRAVRANEWLLYVTDSPWAGDGRGLARGSIYNQQRQLVATAVQELVVGVRDTQ